MVLGPYKTLLLVTWRSDNSATVPPGLENLPKEFSSKAVFPLTSAFVMIMVAPAVSIDNAPDLEAKLPMRFELSMRNWSVYLLFVFPE